MIVPGGLVGAHRDAAPLLELVDAAFDDVAPSVAEALVVAEVDRPAKALAVVSDLVIALRDRGGDVPFAQPSPVDFRRVALVREDPIRPRPRSAGASGDADLKECSTSMLVSAACPGASTNASARPFPSQTR
ncbi:hypothetical protein [Brachybacterium sp. Marseille-Q7125]|uniref:hypothetical protein n=1 Tax=Brachybacterium sp. Marseille-Q7125 TaxID=2932815 RepID=UPI001FF12103|nr:hypothetical protein [Brachybacterium sp. Marseille-Q7125]